MPQYSGTLYERAGAASGRDDRASSPSVGGAEHLPVEPPGELRRTETLAPGRPAERVGPAGGERVAGLQREVASEEHPEPWLVYRLLRGTTQVEEAEEDLHLRLGLHEPTGDAEGEQW